MDFSAPEEAVVTNYLEVLARAVLMMLGQGEKGIAILPKDENTYTYILLKNAAEYKQKSKRDGKWVVTVRVEWCMANSNAKMFQFFRTDITNLRTIISIPPAMTQIKQHLEAHAVKTGQSIACLRGESKIYHGYIGHEEE